MQMVLGSEDSDQKGKSLRIACVQIDCKHGQVERNREKVLELTKK